MPVLEKFTPSKGFEILSFKKILTANHKTLNLNKYEIRKKTNSSKPKLTVQVI